MLGGEIDEELHAQEKKGEIIELSKTKEDIRDEVGEKEDIDHGEKGKEFSQPGDPSVPEKSPDKACCQKHLVWGVHHDPLHRGKVSIPPVFISLKSPSKFP